MKEKENELYLKWVDLLENCIERMANNSFQIKKWAMAVVLAAIALIPENTSINPRIVVVCIAIGTFGFWMLDSYYLMLEKAFKNKYLDVIEYMEGTKEIKETPLSLKTKRDFDLFFKCVKRPVEFGFYIILLIICMIAFLVAQN